MRVAPFHKEGHVMTTTDTQPARAAATPTTVSRTGPETWLAIGLLLLGAGAASVALLGPLVFDVIRYHVSEEALNQVVGGDVAGLVLVAPISIVAGILVWRSHIAGAVLALGPAVYGLYMHSQLALGGDFVRYEGNSEMFFPLYLGLFVLAGAIAIRAWSMIDGNRLPTRSRAMDRFVGWFALVVAVFLVVGLHLPGLVEVLGGEPGTEYLADPVVFWLVKFMDLGLVVPALVAIGVGVLCDTPWATRAKYAAVGWMALLGTSVAGMAVVMQATGDPAGSWANTIAFSAFAAIGLVVAVILYRPLFSSGATPHSD